MARLHGPTSEMQAQEGFNEAPCVRVKIDARREGDIFSATLCNAARLNVLDSALMQQMLEALTSPDALAARVVVVRGDGDRAWVGGADIREMATLDPSSARRLITTLHELCRAVRHHPAPVIALIHGYCLGAGLELAACCDLRLAVEGSTFGMPEVQVGIPSVIEAALLPRLIGPARARDLVLTGRLIDNDHRRALEPGSSRQRTRRQRSACSRRASDRC